MDLMLSVRDSEGLKECRDLSLLRIGFDLVFSEINDAERGLSIGKRVVIENDHYLWRIYLSIDNMNRFA